MWRLALLTSAALSLTTPSPATAAPDPCAPIAAAFEKLAAAPAYRQLTRAFGRKPATSLAIGQRFYVQNEGEWQALELKPGERQSMMKAAIGSHMRDCRQKGPEAFEGAPVTVYGYSPSTELEAQGAASQTVWIGGDGLPRRLFSTTVEIEFSYDDVNAPPVAPTARPK